MAPSFPKQPRSKAGSDDFHTELVRSSPCAACLMLGRWSPDRSEAHHLKEGHGLAVKASNFEQIPLCPNHHTLGPKGVAFHEDSEAWPWNQRDLLGRYWKLWILAGRIPKGTPVGHAYKEPPPRSISTFIPVEKFIRLFRTLVLPPEGPSD